MDFMIKTLLITDADHLQEAFRIREEVFVREQNVPAEEEYDDHEQVSRHFLAFCNGQPCGTARWRFTNYGIKLERFAVRKDFRGRWVGSALVQAVLDDIGAAENTRGKPLYMHAQLTAMPLYAKFGFQPVGDAFDECAIPHYKMERMPTSGTEHP